MVAHVYLARGLQIHMLAQQGWTVQTMDGVFPSYTRVSSATQLLFLLASFHDIVLSCDAVSWQKIPLKPIHG